MNLFSMADQKQADKVLKAEKRKAQERKQSEAISSHIQHFIFQGKVEAECSLCAGLTVERMGV